MKLLNREPTPEMLSIISNEKEVFHSAESLYAALYDAAPEADVQAEIAKRDARIAELEEDKATLVRNCNQSFDAMQGQQETIEKQATRIKELEMAIDNEMVMAHIGVFNSGDDPKVALNKLQCYAEDLGSFFAQDQLNLQAAEIAQLKDALLRITQVKADTVTTAYDMRRIALATIKECENATN